MKKKIYALLLTAALTLITACPAFAGTYTSDGTANALVTAEVNSSYTILLPATIALTDPDNDNTYTGDYTIGAKGNINIAKKVACAPTSNTFTMTGNNSTSVTATVTQSLTAWVNNASPSAGNKNINLVNDSGAYENYSTITGSISAPITNAGTYQGNMEFTFGLADI